MPRDRETEYGALIGAIHAALRDTGSAEDRIVDSSKSIRGLDALVRSSNVRVRVLHIVRDGEAVASSYKRRGYNVYYGMSAWVLVNAFLRLFLSRRKIPNLRIDYPALCAFPDAELARVDAFLGTESSGKDVIEAVSRRRYHIFAGNAVVRGLTRGFPGIEFRGDCSALNGFERAVAGVFLRPVHRLLRTGTP